MSANLARPAAESVTIAGPAGSLEALLEIPAGADGSRVAVICHPHPVYGGTMTNKVVHMLAKSFNERGVPALRFNFRGVGASAGTTTKAKARRRTHSRRSIGLRSAFRVRRYGLAGFSFGGAIAVRAAVARNAKRLVTVAPAVQRFAVDGAQLPRCPWLLVQGDRDELVDAGEIQRWVATLEHPPRLALLPGVDHFFHGRLNELRAVVLEWLSATEVEQMIEHLKRMFAGQPAAQGLLEQREPLDLATAALLIELARSDFGESTAEVDAIRHLLQKRFGLSAAGGGNAADAGSNCAPIAPFRCTNSPTG